METRKAMPRSIQNGGSWGRRDASPRIDRDKAGDCLGDKAAGGSGGSWVGLGLEDREGVVGSSAGCSSRAADDTIVGNSGELIPSD